MHTLNIRDATIPFFQNCSNTSAVFFNQCRISILLCVDLIVSLLCVKHNLLQCFSTGGSRLGMQPKSGWRDRSEWVLDIRQILMSFDYFSNVHEYKP